MQDFDDSLAIDLELGESIKLSGSFLDNAVHSADENRDDDSILDAEISATGRLNFSVYSSYWRAIGLLLCLAILLAILLMQVKCN